MKFFLLNAVKAIAVGNGFLAALSFMRSISSTFHWHMYYIYGSRFSFGTAASLALLLVCLAALAAAMWLTKSKIRLFFRKTDFSLLIMLCGAGVYACYHILRGAMLTPWEITRGVDFSRIRPNMPPTSTEFLRLVEFDGADLYMSMNLAEYRPYLILVPVIAYLLAVFVYTELIARLRDKTLLRTFYWPRFFGKYPIWRLVGLLAALFLISQIIVAAFYGFLPLRLLSLAVICALTYFAAFVLNLSKEFEDANADKIRAERLKGELITNVSHDIRTPLTSIINYVDLMKNEALPPAAAGHLQVLEKKSARLKNLLNDLIEASNASTGNIKTHIHEIDLSEIIGQAAGEFDFAANNLTLVTRQPDTPVIINADSRHLFRALENLFSNAVKYSLDGTRVFAEISGEKGKTIFTLQNTTKTPMEFSGPDLTEQFTRGDKSRTTEGSGLGLYIAKSLLELSGGKLNISVIGDLFRVEVVF